jgi:hypothetical protein
LWTITEPLLWLFYILLVLEIYRLVLEDYKGIYSVGRWALYVCLTLAVIASGSTLLPGWNTGNAKSPMVLFYLVIERGVIFSMVLFILLLGLFLSSYPIRISRNIIVHTALYTVYFLSSTLMLLVQALTGFHVSKAFNTGLVLTGILCGFGWLILLKKEEQASRVVLRYEWKPEDEERLVQQLTAINSSLLRTVRK